MLSLVKVMCGIIGIIGDDSFSLCLQGLQQLQNRGYDSAGIASTLPYVCSKYASTNEQLALEQLQHEASRHVYATLSVGHTRWATHGEKSSVNAHPHTSFSGRFTLVHNGIVQNYLALKTFLCAQGYVFASETDTEIIVNLIDYYSTKYNTIDSISECTKQLEGSWAFICIDLETPSQFYCARRECPLLFASTGNLTMIASEYSGFSGHMNHYHILEEEKVYAFDRHSMLTTERIIHIEQELFQTTPDPYPYWTLKEIYEQPASCQRTIEQSLDECPMIMSKHLILLGCGTSYYSGLFGTHLFKELGDLSTVQCFDGSEFTERDIPEEGTCCIFLSQSGETKDLYRCIPICRTKQCYSIGVINVEYSLIAREVDYCFYVKAGREVAVASTKSYLAQVIALYKLAYHFAKRDLPSDIYRLPKDIHDTILHTEDMIEDMCEVFLPHSSCFIIGKGKCESVAREGSLKVKEISYLHAEGTSSSSLKHGPFSLLTDTFPVILCCPNDEFLAINQSIIEELKSRKASVWTITNANLGGRTVHIPHNITFQHVLCIIPIQLLSYHLALRKGFNPDFPRNLAKVVTVE